VGEQKYLFGEVKRYGKGFFENFPLMQLEEDQEDEEEEEDDEEEDEEEP